MLRLEGLVNPPSLLACSQTSPLHNHWLEESDSGVWTNTRVFLGPAGGPRAEQLSSGIQQWKEKVGPPWASALQTCSKYQIMNGAKTPRCWAHSQIKYM